ncbi:neutral amino acid transporter 9-like isoform X3 [Mytilus trossulus]|uniref:neutral amino acid transporter 9-like isoform X1 n=1 Tax=Mytilus trossulus TaxID=6551 RepID=UPI00300754D1
MDRNRHMSVNSPDDEIRTLLSSSNSENLQHKEEGPSASSQTRSKPIPKKSAEKEASQQRTRQPVNYASINNPNSGSHEDERASAIISRYKYYNRLAPHGSNNFLMPDHVVPQVFINYVFKPIPGEQSSIVTIFSLWNTMMGTSLLSMPWAIRQAGFATGIPLLVFMAGINLYTSYRILKTSQEYSVDGQLVEFSDVCKHYLGKWAQYLAVVSSLLTLLGGAIVYWILMSNFLYNVVLFIWHKAEHDSSNVGNMNNTNPDIVCNVHHPDMNHTSYPSGSHTHEDSFDKIWNVSYTVPFFLILILGPLVNFKSPTFFTKFNALATLSVTYLIIFVIINAAKWGINVEFTGNEQQMFYVADFKGSFPALTGIAALAYFVQNSCVSIVRNQKYPENNIRDLIIAYILVAFTYIFVGVMFYISFPMEKDCIEDNLLNNMSDTYVLAFVARISLFFQMMCVFPLLLYIFRVQLLYTIYNTVWPGLRHVLVLNVCIIAVCVVFAVFLPHIGKIIGFFGAFCGFAYAIMLPCLVHLTIQHRNGEQSILSTILHSCLIVLGLANFVGQFLVLNVK